MNNFLTSNDSFKKYADKMNKHISKMCDENDHLFQFTIDKHEMFERYLSAFPEGCNEIFRVRERFNCSTCRNFIFNFANVFAIVKNNNETFKIVTIWDFKSGNSVYDEVSTKMSEYVRSKLIYGVFLTSSNRKTFGKPMDIETIENNNTTITWYHFNITVPDKFIIYRENPTEKIGEYRDNFNVFKRALDEFTTESISTVIELINDRCLLRGDDVLHYVEQLGGLKKKYEKITDEQQKILFCWHHAVTEKPRLLRIRNSEIGTLLIDLSEGRELMSAVRSYNEKADPENHCRGKADAELNNLFIRDAKKYCEENGFIDSLDRRFATLADIKISNVLHANRDAKSRMENNPFSNAFNSLEKTSAPEFNPKKNENVPSMSFDDFIKNVAPTATKIELFFENRLSNNRVSLIAPNKKDSKPITKWANNFGWAYTGNITGVSEIRKNVEKAGGKVDAEIGFRLQWNDVAPEPSDLDAHCAFRPLGDKTYTINPAEYKKVIDYRRKNASTLSRRKNYDEVYFGDKDRYFVDGKEVTNVKHNTKPNISLDIDIRYPETNNGEPIPAVENIYFNKIKDITPGVYALFVHCWEKRGSNVRFTAEIEYDGTIRTYSYDKNMANNGIVQVANVVIKNDHSVEIIDMMKPDNDISKKKEYWNVTTNTFIPVTAIMNSPNYWDDGDCVGTKHTFFMLDGMVNDERPNSIFNEFLPSELHKYKKVMNQLGNNLPVADQNDQLSGIGFYSNYGNNHVFLRVVGATDRIIKVVF